MSQFSANDVMEFALAIERNGEKFYRLAQERVADAQVKAVFRKLATDEVAHERVFARLLGAVGAFDPGEEFPEEYFAYLRAFVDQVVFSDEKLDAAIAEVEDGAGAVRFAMQREQDAILFYSEIRNLVPPSERGVIDELLAEERRHYTTLAELEKDMAGN